MKCERCQFAPIPDSEGFTDECPNYDTHGKAWKDGSYGCTLSYQALKKQDEEYAEYLGNMGEDMGTDMVFRDNGWDLRKAIENMMHMIGMYPEGVRHPYKRHGKVFYKPYRNYWSGENKYLDYFSGCIGFVKKHEPAVCGQHPMYTLTERGIKWLGRQLDVTIYPEED